jgi:hypothetical protein
MDLLGAIKDTPLPTVLVVAGIVFWLLAIAGSLAGKITVRPEHQMTAGILGTILLVSGLVLSICLLPNHAPTLALCLLPHLLCLLPINPLNQARTRSANSTEIGWFVARGAPEDQSLISKSISRAAKSADGSNQRK